MFSRTKTLKESFQHFQYLIHKTYEPEESRSISQIVFKEVLGYNTIQLILNENELVSASMFEQLDQIAHLLNQHQPVQYILGFEEFMGMRFNVNSNVLIPRPETEELVEWIIKDHAHSEDIRILDIGTGSGCIAISLKKNLHQAHVDAIDVSIHALQIAQKNAKTLGADVHFIQQNILQEELIKSYDIIVSNPPYVLESEKQYMHKNVLDYEPSLALYVPDKDPLLFYKRIITQAESQLNDKGILYFEINESFADELKQLFDSKYWRTIEIRKDVREKERMLKAIKH